MEIYTLLLPEPQRYQKATSLFTQCFGIYAVTETVCIQVLAKGLLTSDMANIVSSTQSNLQAVLQAIFP